LGQDFYYSESEMAQIILFIAERDHQAAGGKDQNILHDQGGVSVKHSALLGLGPYIIPVPRVIWQSDVSNKVRKAEALMASFMSEEYHLVRNKSLIHSIHECLSDQQTGIHQSFFPYTCLLSLLFLSVPG